MKVLLDDERATPGGRFRSVTTDSRGQWRSNSTTSTASSVRSRAVRADVADRAEQKDGATPPPRALQLLANVEADAPSADGDPRTGDARKSEKPPHRDAMSDGLEALHGILRQLQNEATTAKPSSEALRIAAETLHRMVESERCRLTTTGPAPTGSEELSRAQEGIDEILRAAVDAFAHVPRRGGRS